MKRRKKPRIMSARVERDPRDFVVYYYHNGLIAGRNSGVLNTIVDFSHAQLDKIHLQAIDARTTMAGDQAFIFIGAAAFSNVAGQLRAEVVSGNSLVHGDVNGDAVADFSIVVADFTGLQASDFVL